MIDCEKKIEEYSIDDLEQIEEEIANATKTINVRVSLARKKIYAREADRAGKTLSAWIVDALDDEARGVKK
jgi:predicted HicB family RNase H-like nuclease